MLKTPPARSDIRRFLHHAAGALISGKRALDSLLFPFKCPGCSDILPYPEALCECCCLKLARIRKPFCKRCGGPFPEFWRVKICPECRITPTPLTRVRSCFLYEGLVRDMIREAKYRRSARFLRYFAGEMYVLARAEYPSKISAVIPVPLHRARQWDRTYNQAELMARDISRWWGIPLWKGLRRVRRTPPQSGLSGRARRRNLQNAFAVIEGSVPKNVLLLDDVVTTGATLETCARTLRRKGVRRVYAITIARAVKQIR